MAVPLSFLSSTPFLSPIGSLFGQHRRFFRTFYLIRPTFVPQAVVEKKEIVNIINSQTGAVDKQSVLVTRRPVARTQRPGRAKKRRTLALAIPEVF